MINFKDHKTMNMFDPLDQYDSQKRKLLKKSWAHLFREEILPHLPVKEYCKKRSDIGAPTKELFSMLGLTFLQQIFDLTDVMAVSYFVFNEQWHYALGIDYEETKSIYVAERTVWQYRQNMINLGLDKTIFETMSTKLQELFDVDTSFQRLDSVHLVSNMRHLGRISLFSKTIKTFLVNLKRQHKGKSGIGKLEKTFRDRFLSKEENSVFALVKPTESAKTLESLAKDLQFIIRTFQDDKQICKMNSYQNLIRLLEEQCIVSQDEKSCEETVTLKENEDVPSDSLQNPSDPDATYDGHKGQGYQAQICETYNPDKEEGEPSLSLITYVSAEPAHKHDSKALIPAIKATAQADMLPKKILADTAYGSDKNCQEAKNKYDCECVSPIQGKKPENKLSLADFSFNEKGEIISCPQGQFPLEKTNHNKSKTAVFDQSACFNCPQFQECPNRYSEKGYLINYTEKDHRLAKRRAYQNTTEFSDDYRYRSGVEATMSQLDRKTGIKHLRYRGMKNVSFCVYLKAAGVNLFRAVAFKNQLMPT